MKQADKILNSSLNSEGSAIKEYNTTLEGIEGHINDLKSAFQILSNTVVNSDVVKFVISSGTTALNLLSDIIKILGGAPALLTAITAGLSAIKNVGELIQIRPFLCYHRHKA